MSNKSNTGRQGFRFEAQPAASDGYAAAILTQELTRACTTRQLERSYGAEKLCLFPHRLGFISACDRRPG